MGEFWDTNGSSNLGQTTRPSESQQKKKKKGTRRIVAIAVQADHRVEMKEIKKRYKCLDLARELKRLWNMKVTVIPVVIGVPVTVTKGLVLGLKGEGRPSWLPIGPNSEKNPRDVARLAVT